MSSSTKRLPTHLFLASLGKTRLRPGGKEATDRIIASCQITSESKVLEVAPNMGTTAMYLAKTFGCHVTGIDIHAPSIEKAKENIKANQLEHLISIQHGNALDLPFENESFDFVINEAMLSMLPHELKQKAISEYFRVLKPGGKLVTHDLLLKQDPNNELIEERLKNLRKLLIVNAQPMMQEDWHALFESVPFKDINYQTGKMVLLSLKGLLVDEGWEGLLNIINNAMKDPDSKEYLFDLIKTFDDNDDLYGHITFSATK
jgi:ubiquinone/menaquinone biosynthesis C-methylase UbiE